MLISHNLENINIRSQSDPDVGFLLTNKSGGFTFLGATHNTSRFQGVFLSRDFNYFKVIENIRLLASEPDSLRNNFFSIERKSGNARETFSTNHTNALLYEVNDFKGFAEVTLDCRKMHDYDDKGRIYDIYRLDDTIIVEYTKYADSSLKDASYSIFLAIKGVREYAKIGSWEKRHYDFDMKRRSGPWEMYVYKALKLKIDGSQKIVFSYSDNRQEAIDNAGHAMENFDFIRKSKENYARTRLSGKLEGADGQDTAGLQSKHQCNREFHHHRHRWGNRDTGRLSVVHAVLDQG